MTHKTKGIVLRSIRYGETSLVVTVFTEKFGVQAYLVNGVRKGGKTGAKAGYFVPGALLDLVVYHHEQKNLQRIREYSWAALYGTVLTDVIKNNVALYFMELLYKCLKQPEQHEALFYFSEDVLLQLDNAGATRTANLPLYFALNLPQFLGFRINDDYSATHPVLDLQEGCFMAEIPLHPHYLEGEQAYQLAQLLKVMLPAELDQFSMHHAQRRALLQHLHTYYALHIPDFGNMKTLEVLQHVL